MLDLKKIPSLGNRVKFRIRVLICVWEKGDHRYWNAIKVWASSLNTRLD